MFDKQPQLTGKTILLRPLVKNDLEGLFICGGDERVWAGHPSPERYKRENFEKWFSTAFESNSALTIVECGTNKIIGSTRYYFDETPRDEISIGYTFLAHRCWGGVVNSELKSIMLKHAFKSFGAVWFHVSPLNIRSQKAMLKIGANHIKDEIVSLGGSDPTLWKFYKINRQDWCAEDK